MRFLRYIISIPKCIFLVLIKVYQELLSPDHSFWSDKFYPYGFCKFHPTCSEYCRKSIKKKGVIKGSFSCIWRVFKCNPWSKGGVDKPD